MNDPFLAIFLMAKKQTHLNYFGFTSPVVYFLGLDNALPLSLFFFLLLTSNQEQKCSVIFQKNPISFFNFFFLHHKILCLFHVHLQSHGLHWELFRTKERRIKRERVRERKRKREILKGNKCINLFSFIDGHPIILGLDKRTKCDHSFFILT